MDNTAKVIKAKDYSPNLATRRQRRAAVHRLTIQLKEILDNEVIYRDNTPDTMRGSEMYDISDYCICNLDEALDILESAYES